MYKGNNQPTPEILQSLGTAPEHSQPTRALTCFDVRVTTVALDLRNQNLIFLSYLLYLRTSLLSLSTFSIVKIGTQFVL